MYDEQTLENMFDRFEEPNSMVRWDSPLFTVLWDDPQLDDAQDSAIGKSIVEALTAEGGVKPPNAGTTAVKKAPGDALKILESASLAVVSAVLDAQSMGITGASIPITAASVQTRITLPQRTLSMPELQRLKRQFVTVHKKAVTTGTTEKGQVLWDEQNVVVKFVTYLEERWKAG